MPLIPIRPKGRPSSVCEHCKDVRQRKKTNDGCICDSPNHIPTCPCVFKQELCTCKPSKRASSSITKRQPSKGRRSTTTTAELLTKTPSNNLLLPQPRAMSVTDTCKVAKEEEEEEEETPDFLSPQTVNYSFDFVGKHQNQQKLAILKTPPSRSNSVDTSTNTTSHSTPVQSPLSSSVTIANTCSEPSPKTQPPVTVSSSFKVRPPSMTPEFPSIRSLRDGEEQGVRLPIPRRLSVAYSPSLDSGSPKSFESSKGCPNNDNKTTTVHSMSTYNGDNLNNSRYKYSDRLPLPPLIPTTKVVDAIDSPWSWKSIPPTKLSTLLDPDTFLDRTDYNYRRASIGSLPSLSTTSSLYLPSISSITYTVSSTRTAPAVNRLGRRVSVDEATRCNDKSPEISKFLQDGNSSGTEYKPSILTQDTRSIKVAGLPSIRNDSIKAKLKYEQENPNFCLTRLSPLSPGRVSKNPRTSIQSLIHSSSPTTQ